MKNLLRLFLPIVSIPALSRMWGRIVRIKHPRFLIKRIIEGYSRAYGINMDEYVGEAGDYKSLSNFFTRKLNPEKRPLKADESLLVSPADGVLTKVETIFKDSALQVKGKSYSVSEFLKEDIDFSEGWHVATIYLSPSNYHRYHYPLTGKITRYFHTGGKLFPVNQMGLNNIDQLFVRNERIITEIKKNGMPAYIVAVGATFVGSIKMEFIKNKKLKKHWEPVDRDVCQLEEMGRFEMGSTIVMVIPKKAAEPVESEEGKTIRVGEPIFKWLL